MVFKKLHFAVLLFLGLTLLSCESQSRPKSYHGDLHTNSTLVLQDRVQIQKGDHLVVSAQLRYSVGPKGAHDGDSGSDLYIQFLDTKILQKGKTYKWSDSRLLVYTADWASPAGYKLFKKPDITGEFLVQDYQKDKSLTLKFKITYPKADTKPKTFSDIITFK